jgi:hypothetical protein
MDMRFGTWTVRSLYRAGSLRTVAEEIFSKHNYSDQVKEDEMGRACSTNGGEEECI